MNSQILLIEDDVAIATSLECVLAAEGWAVTHAARGDDGLALAQQRSFDLVLTDLKLPGTGGLEIVRRLHAARPRLPIVLMTAHGTTETAIEAIKFGAFDYLLKPFDMGELIELVSKALAAHRLMTEPVDLGVVEAVGHAAIVGQSRVMQAIYKEIGRIAAKPVNVLIRGETGTGKELIARAIYQHSDRALAPFVAVNCAAIPETLLESELFGHERGAFTGADMRRIGRFEQAHTGTLFLDEIGDLTPNTQVKLLRVLQERNLQRLGGKETIPADVRVIAATHRNLEVMMRERQFREDLFYRLNVVTVTLPPLRERREDVPDLVRYMLRRYGTELGTSEPSIQPEALELLKEQLWPGNVRELENTVRKILLHARGYTISVEHVRTALVPTAVAGAAYTGPTLKLIGDLLAAAQRGEREDVYAEVISATERELLAQAIELADGNQAKAARWLGISRLTLREKLRQYSLHPTQDPVG
ncbi:MAG: sigma-54-dependent Fis family transcriptional regulator [Verrucomicrobia bacterium]|nr:sigma-54-dependent Fis family transcriptional regulator [Verrucomicrobiota bacterium]NBU09443.1 sigma-54-dependent Fis family transcriptional regulator [Pseudomonadota bacterium]NDA65518.1 sigma-54-dependent Fis family transcriptional regulator [Verrucomicrobiota bacterium]NDB74488.1 sigma-54-dependent Fis family transcriptional regulator [Verrucomicrobiota bacterium]NDD37383.1 sigma-54-dependent Fis family transcriptional regulator [Verrucomicrobiota bacterium]